MRVSISLAVLAITVFAGCAGIDQDAPVLTIDGALQPYASLGQERPELASVAWREIREAGTDQLADDLLGDDGWESRDATLSYHGLAEVHNSWGRLVPAHVFAYNPLVYFIDQLDINFATGQMTISGHWEPKNYEFYFDAADGAYIGLYDIDAEVRQFDDQDPRLPFAPGYAGSLFVEMIRMMAGTLEAPLSWEASGYTYTHELKPYDGKAPLGGRCDVYERHIGVERPASAPAPPEPEADPDPHRVLVCVDDSDLPLWTYAGSETHGSIALVRDSTGIDWPDAAGDVLADDPFETGPMDLIEPTTPLSAPIYVPPADGRGDWAYELHPRAEALHLGSAYIQYSQKHSETQAQHVITGWPSSVLPMGNVPVLPPVAETLPRVESTAWMIMTEGEGFLWNNVDKYRVGEGTTNFVADTRGSDFDFGARQYHTRQDLGDLVRTDSVQGRVPEFSPTDPSMIKFHQWPKWNADSEPMVDWWILEECFGTAVEEPTFLHFDAITGQLRLAGRMVSHDSGCSAGGSGSSSSSSRGFVFGEFMPGLHFETIIAPTSEMPFEIRLNQDGTLAQPLLTEQLALMAALQTNR